MTDQALVKKDPAAVEFIPYGSHDKVKLSVAMVQNLIAVKTKSGKTCSERDAIKFLAMCQAKRINPFEGDCFLIGYDGNDGPSFSLVTAHQTYLKRAELHPEFDGMQSGIIVEEDGGLKDLEGDFFMEGQKLVGGWAKVFFKSRSHPMSKRLRLSRFNKGFGIWRDDPAGMICKCAEADALRSSFPTMLGGLFLREELESDPEKRETDFSRPLFNTPAVANLTNGHGAEPAALPEKSAARSGRAPGDPRRLLTQPEPAVNQTPPVEPEPPMRSGDEDFAAQPIAKPETALSQPALTVNTLQALRNHAKMAGLTEGQLLDFLSGIGSTDGSVSSLDELVMQYESLANLILKDWAGIAARIKVQKGAAA